MLPYCWNDETPLSNHELRMDDDVYQNRQDPAVTVGLRLGDRRAGAGLDHHAVDPARPTWRSWSGPTSTTSSSSPTSPGRPSATSSPRPGWRPTPSELGRATPAEHGSSQRLKGADLVGRALHAAVLLLPGPRAGAPRLRRPTSSPPRTAPGWCTRAGAFGEEDKIVTDARGHRAGRARSAPTAGSPARSPTTRACTSSTPTRRSSTTSRPRTRGEGDDRLGHRGHRAAAPRDLRPLLPALLALPRAADLHGGLVAGSSRSPSSRTGWSSSTSRSPGCPSTSRTASSASGWRTPATGRSRRNRFWGSPIPVWKSDDPEYPRIDVYGSFEELEARLRRCDGRPTCTGRSSTS